jgi:hypothetical protein
MMDDPHEGLPTSSGSRWPLAVFSVFYFGGIIYAIAYLITHW